MMQHVGIDQRRLHIPMPEEFLNRADVIAIFQEVRVERVPRVWQLAILVSHMVLAASLTARCRTDSCR
jgi:hypothetical protein